MVPPHFRLELHGMLEENPPAGENWFTSEEGKDPDEYGPAANPCIRMVDESTRPFETTPGATDA